VKSCMVQNLLGEDFLVIETIPEAPLAIETETAVMLGNVAMATHGETVKDEILGSGNAAEPFQTVQLRKKPLTRLASGANAGGVSTARILVNGEKWSEVDSLYGQPAEARVYKLRQADDGTTLLQFGDGVTGARLPTGSGNLVATYRHGAGLEGRVAAGQLSVLLDRPPGLKDGVNPMPARGGADPETLDQARQTAPTKVKTFDRAVSLRDFETLVTASGEVAKASATWTWTGLEKTIHLTVAAQKGGVFDAEGLKTLWSGLLAGRDPNQALLIDNFCRVPIVVYASVQVDAAHDREKTRKAAVAALSDALAFERIEFARSIRLSEIYAVLQNVTGVASTLITRLHFKGSWTDAQLRGRGATADSVQPYLRIYGARPRPEVIDPAVTAAFRAAVPAVLPAEQAYFEAEAQDIAITAGGGIA